MHLNLGFFVCFSILHEFSAVESFPPPRQHSIVQLDLFSANF